MTTNDSRRAMRAFHAASLLEETMEGLRTTQRHLLAQDPDDITTRAPLLARLATAMTQAARVHDQITHADDREEHR